MKPRHTLIIGGGSAIGQAVAKHLIQAGVAVSSLSRNPLPEDVTYRNTRTTDYASADWGALLRELGEPEPIDSILFAPGYAALGPVQTIPEKEARQTLEVNFWFLNAAARAAADYWTDKKMPGDFWGVLSLAALRAIPDEGYYCAAKAAAARLLECLDLENRKMSRRFRYFCPGKFESAFRERSPRFQAAAETGGGSSLDFVSSKIATAILTRKGAKVIGWRENVIALADRLFPELYDRLVLDRRTSS